MIQKRNKLTKATAVSAKKVETFREQFNHRELFWITVGIILLIILGVLVFRFDILPTDVFIDGMSKYNVSAGAGGPGGLEGLGGLVR